MVIDESLNYSKKETILMVSGIISSVIVLLISSLVLIFDGIVLLAWGKYLPSIIRIVVELVIAAIAMVITIVNCKIVSSNHGKITGKKNIIFFVVYNVLIAFSLILAPFAILTLFMLILEKKKKRS